MSNNNTRVVVTGMGIVCSAGSNMTDFFQSLDRARPGISLLVDMPVCRGKALAAQIKSPPLNSPMRLYRLARTAMQEALNDAGPRPYFFGKTGLFCATVGGDSYSLERQFKHFAKDSHRRKKDMALARVFPAGDLAHRLGRYFGLRHVRESNSNACASGNIALARARHKIMSGQLSRAIVCGAEQLKPTAYWGCDRAGILGSFCGPFSRRRDGTILGDGAAVLILENYAAALARGAKIHAEILGYGTSCSYQPHEIIPDLSGDGVARSLQNALKDASLLAEEIDYINAHATGTVNIEISECAGIIKVFGSLSEPFVNSSKSITGHVSAASAVIETIATIHSLKNDFIHANAGLSDPDDTLGVNLVGQQGKSVEIKRAINISLGAGGVNTAVVLGKAPANEEVSVPSLRQKRPRIGISSLASIIARGEQGSPTHCQKRVDFDHLAESYPVIRSAQHLNRTAVLGFAAAARLLEHHDIFAETAIDEKLGLLCATALGGNGQWSGELCATFDENPRHITPSQALSHGAHLTNTLLAREYGLIGTTYTLMNGWFSAFSAMDCAMDMIALDGVETVIITATDALDPLTEKAMTLFPATSPLFRAESAAALIVESEKRFKDTGRRPQAWLTAVDFDYGDSLNLKNHLIAPHFTEPGMIRLPNLGEYGAATPFLALESMLASFKTGKKSMAGQEIVIGGVIGGLGAAQMTLEMPEGEKN